MIQATLNKDGSFSEHDMILFDTTKIYYKLTGSNSFNNSTEVTFNTGMVPSKPKIVFEKNPMLLSLDTATENRNRYFAEQQARLAKLLEGTTLQGVTVKAKTKSPSQLLDEKYTSGLFSGGDAHQFDVSNDPTAQGALNVLSYLQGRVA